MEIEILNVRLPKEITDWLDSLVKRGVYKSRSEAIREFSREYISKVKTSAKGGSVD
jgi:Arc/MetJ-type ribon-helix-helix transcriptional regulator